MKFYLFIGLFLTPFLLDAEEVREVIDVSLVQLISSPEKYEGKNVRFVGFLHLGFEDDAIYLHEEDYRKAIRKNGLWVDVSQGMPKYMDRMNGRYVSIEGIFRSKEKGHLGLWSGTVTQISEAFTWPLEMTASGQSN